MNKTIRCPLCGQVEPVEKVSTLYLKGIGLKEELGTHSGLGNDVPPAPMKTMHALSRKLAPPSGGRAGFTRPVNPDLAILAFSAVMPVFIYGIWTSQRILLLPVLGILVIFYALFFWQRGRMVNRYRQDLASRQAVETRVKKGIELWMKLYYCADDEVVFEPGKGEPVSVDLLPGLLSEKK